MTKGRVGIGLLMGAAAALIGGCAHHPPSQVSVVGTWAATAKENDGQTEPYKLTFNPDGREVMTMEVQAKDKVYAVNAEGTYQVSGTTLTQTWSMAQVNGKQEPLQVLGSAVHSETYQYQVQGNTLTLTQPNNAMSLVLTRQGT